MTPRLAPPTPDRFTSRLRCPAVAARVGVWLGISFGICFVTGLISHYAQLPRRPDRLPHQPELGLPADPGAARHLRLRRDPAAAGEAVVGAAPASSRPAPARPPPARCSPGSSAPRSPCSSPPRSSSSRPAWPTPPSGIPGPPSPSAPPTTPSPGSRSAPWCCTSRSSCRSSATRSAATSTPPPTTAPPRRARTAVAPRAGAHDVRGRRARGPRDRRQHRAVAAPGVGLRRPHRRGAGRGADQQVRPRRRGRGVRESPDWRARGGRRRRRRRLVVVRRPAGDAAAHRRPADRLRRGVERAGHVDGRPDGRRALRGVGAPTGATCRSPRSSSPAPTGARPCRRTSPTTSAPCSPSTWPASRWPSTTASRAG